MADLAIAGTEPILWQSTKLSANDADRQTIVTNPDGTTKVIRHPQHGHIGSYENRQRAFGMRYANVLHHNGNVVPLVLTNAAADTNSGGEYGNLMRAKALHHGWFSPSQCPIALLANAQLDPKLVRAKALLQERTPCDRASYDESNPCVHTRAEQDARRAQHDAEQRRKADENKSEADKALAEANSNTAKLLEQVVAQGQSANQMMALFAQFLQTQIVKTDPPPSPPTTPTSTTEAATDAKTEPKKK